MKIVIERANGSVVCNVYCGDTFISILSPPQPSALLFFFFLIIIIFLNTLLPAGVFLSVKKKNKKIQWIGGYKSDNTSLPIVNFYGSHSHDLQQ